VLAAPLGYFIVPNVSEGWRWVQVISAIPIVMILWWRRTVPESPRWLLEQGHDEEAEAVASRFEEEIVSHTGASLPPVEEAEVPRPVPPRQGRSSQTSLLCGEVLWPA